MAQRDLSFESLTTVTSSQLPSARGALNAALKEIRDQEPGLDDEDLALLIRLRADDYRKVYPGMALTPTALSKHWSRVHAEVERKREERNRVSAETPVRICPTCGGDKIVVVRLRSSENERAPYEECAPCPDCNPIVVSWWRQNGEHRQTPNPSEVRRLLDE